MNPEASKNGALKNRLIDGNYDEFKLVPGVNHINFTGIVKKYCLSSINVGFKGEKKCQITQLTILKWLKGDTESFGFEIDGIDNLDAVYFSFKQNSQNEQYLFQKTLGGGITQSSENLYVVKIAPGDTLLLNPGQYWYDLEIQKNGDVFTVFRGVMDILPEITDPTGSVKPDAIWGRIVGEIENQTDLQAELNTKANISSLSAVATSGSYDDLSNKPSIPTFRVL